MNHSKSIKSRRGISTVVGALFFTVLMIAGFSALALALDAQTDIVDTQRRISDTELKKQQERFSIGANTDENNNLEIFVNNHGQNPVEITSIWIVNKTLTSEPSKRFSIPSNDAYIPSGYGSQILSSLPLTMNPDSYDIKVVSTYGTIEKAELNVDGIGSSNVLRSQLFTIPPDVISGQNVTIAMLVTNTADFPLESVSPAANPPYTNKPASLIASELTSVSSVNLEPKDTVLFKWNAEVSGPLGTNMEFSTYAKGIEPVTGTMYKSANSTDSVTFQIDGGDDGTLIALSKDLLNRPEIFTIIPSPIGSTTNLQMTGALWGVNVVNPINATMEVSKIVITAFAPGGNDNVVFFPKNSCDPSAIFPISGWSCPSENAIMWQDRTNPITLEPYSTKAFLSKIEPVTSQPGGNPVESAIVQTSVFTTAGSFGKTAYQSTFHIGGSSMANVFLSTIPDSTSNADILGDKINITPGSVETFNVVLADMDLIDTTEINSGAKLIINVPREWKDVSIVDNLGFIDPPTIIEFGDGSTQIVAETISSIGNSGNPSDTLTFSARAPNVNTDQLYVMYILADGDTNNGISIGPLAEILLQVESPSTP